jgi:ubiquinone/menaquinone biosynthesis C-methylase UbiE
MKRLLRFVRVGLPAALLATVAFPKSSRAVRVGAAVLLVAFWTAIYVRYRRDGRRRTKREWEQLRATNWEAFWRHYNERVPTIEEEFDIWGPYHQHRHEMRYDLVADEVRRNLPRGGRVLDLGCGSALVADRLDDLNFHYVGMDFGGPHIAYAQKKYADRSGPMSTSFVRGDGEFLPFAAETFDVVVMSEVIEHLLRPELAVWQIARVLKPGGVFVLTTNNASEVPLRSPLSHLFAWIEKGLGATFPSLISYRPWVWPERVDPELLPDGSPDVYIPHSHHIQQETVRMFAAAGLDRVRWSTFEFPPAQSRMAAWFERKGSTGTALVDVLETVATHTPGIRRLGAHVFIVSRKTRDPVAPEPPPGVWPGPLSNGYAG